MFVGEVTHVTHSGSTRTWRIQCDTHGLIAVRHNKTDALEVARRHDTACMKTKEVKHNGT